MWHLSLIKQTMNLKKTAIMLLCSYFIGSAMAADRSKHVILITIDGMRAEMVTDSTMPSPNLKRMKRDGMFVKRIKGITPTATYPSHTTIITGSKPVQHHIYYNSPFTDNQPGPASYWYADSIKALTIWESASRNGLTVASLFWPVSVGAKAIRYNIPEFWSVKPVNNQLEYIKPYCTPAGFLDELEQNATGKLNHENFGAGSMNRDARTAAMANYIMNTYKPNLMTIHLITTDYAQHATGLKSDRVSAAVGGADHAVGLILENLERNKLLDSTTVIVCKLQPKHCPQCLASTRRVAKRKSRRRVESMLLRSGCNDVPLFKRQGRPGHFKQSPQKTGFAASLYPRLVPHRRERGTDSSRM